LCLVDLSQNSGLKFKVVDQVIVELVKVSKTSVLIQEYALKVISL